MANLKSEYLGLQLKNPLVVASSGLTNSVDRIKALEEAGAGAVVLKSIFEEQINNEVGHIISKDLQNKEYPEAEDYIRNYLRNNTIENHFQLVEKSKASVKIPVIASINCISSAEWINFAKDFENAGADALELNIFYLPSDRLIKPGVAESVYIDILSKVKSKVNIPVSVKFGSHHSNIIRMADNLKANGADGVVMFNRFYEPDIDLDKLEMTSSEVLSSPTDIRRTLRWVGMVSSNISNLDIAASTGIHNGDAVLKMILAGANVTQLCSTIYLNGNKIISQILDEITAFMKKWNFKSIDDFKGRLSYKNIDNPFLYERSQFMKYFSDKN